MSANRVPDTWQSGHPYERYIGRWSRQLAPLFLDWLGQPDGRRWLDVGCGTGALSAAIVERCAPASVTALDPSDGFLQVAGQALAGRVRLLSGDAGKLPLASGASDCTVSGLVLNFVPSLPAALAEMRRVTVPGGTVAAYVWDYADGMEVIRRFWDVAVALDPAAAHLHEGTRFQSATRSGLRAAFEQHGLAEVEVAPLEVAAVFRDFDDYWSPFLGGQGPAPAYVMALSEERRGALKAALEKALPRAVDGTLALRARAWAVRGVSPVAA